MLSRLRTLARHYRIRAARPLARLDAYEGVVVRPERRRVVRPVAERKFVRV